MRSIETSADVALAAVKPLEGLRAYRARCLEMTRQALSGGVRTQRTVSPVSGARLEPVGEVEGLMYARCLQSGSLFLVELPEPSRWAHLLSEVNRLRHSPEAFHATLAQSRADHVYTPKLEWIRETLRLQGVERPRVLEVTTAPSDFTALLKASGVCAEVTTIEETALAAGGEHGNARQAQAAVMLESLDRVDDPLALLQAVARGVQPGGLVFITALVSSGFDLAVLGLRNLYLYPPDRTNCFSLTGLATVCERAGFELLEVSTPGALDVEIVQAHRAQNPSLPLSSFERQVVEASRETREAFQTFLQQRGLSSFARLVARKS